MENNKITTNQLYNIIDLKKGEVIHNRKLENISEIFKQMKIIIKQNHMK